MLPPLAILGITNWPNFLTSLLALFALYLIITISLNLEMGYAGIPNFGKVLYFMGGAAFSGSVAIRASAWLLNAKGDPVGLDNFIIASQLTTRLQSDIPASVLLIAVTVAVGAFVGGVLGYISIFPAIRLREDYLAMLLLGAAAFFQIFLGNYSPIINGTLGIGIPNFFAWAGGYGTLAGSLRVRGEDGTVPPWPDSARHAGQRGRVRGPRQGHRGHKEERPNNRLGDHRDRRGPLHDLHG